MYQTLTLSKNWYKNRSIREKHIQATRILKAQLVVKQSNVGILHSGQMAHGPEYPNTSTFGSIPSGEARKVMQQFRTPQDYRVTGGGIPHLTANAAPQLQ